jgi:hypothetical protein
MSMPAVVLLPRADSAERLRRLAVAELRQDALQRLYAKRAAVEDLIKSLEIYQREAAVRSGECIEFTAAR